MEASMSVAVVELWGPWQQVSDASDRIAELVDEIPGWEGYQLAAATCSELRQAAALLQQAIELLTASSARESARAGT
jgi:hypothetical protein